MLFSVRELPLIPMVLADLPFCHSRYLCIMLKEEDHHPGYVTCTNLPKYPSFLLKGFVHSGGSGSTLQMLSLSPPHITLISWYCRVVKMLICLLPIYLPTYLPRHLSTFIRIFSLKQKQEVRRTLKALYGFLHTTLPKILSIFDLPNKCIFF